MRAVGMVALALLLLPGTATGLDPRKPAHGFLQDSWGKREGLPAGLVYAMEEDREGAIWIGSAAGLLRFDGARFDPFELPGSVAPQAVTALRLDPTGALLAGTEGGDLFRVAHGVATRLSTPLDAPITAVVVSRGGDLWVGTKRGVGRRTAGVWQRFDPRNDFVTSLVEDARGRIWAGTLGGGLARFSGSSWDLLDRTRGLPSDFVFSVATSADGSLWAATGEGLVHVREGEMPRTLGLAQGLPARLLQKVLVDASGCVWVMPLASDLHRVRDGAFEPIPGVAGAASLFEGRDGCLWIGGDGLLRRLRDAPVTTLSKADGLPTEKTLCVLVAPDGTVFAGAIGGLLCLRGGHVQLVTARDGLADDTVWSLGPGRDGSVYAATDRGVTRREPSGRLTSWGTREGLRAEGASSVAEDRDGTVWMGTFGGGLGRLEGGRIWNLTVSDGLPSDTVTCLSPARDGGVWVGTDKGLAHAASGRLVPLPEALRLGGERILSVREGADGTVWVGAGLALVTLEGPRVFRYEPPALPIRGVLATVEDGDDLWLVGERLVRVTRRSLAEVAAGRRQRADLTTYGRGDGLPVDGPPGAPNDALATRGPDGAIWIATLVGLARFRPGDLPRVLPAPALSVVRLVADSRPVASGDELASGTAVVPAGSRRLEIEYSAVSLSEPERVRFRHRLLGVEAGWVEAGTRRVAHYMNLAPGPHRFLLEVFDPDGRFPPRRLVVPFRLEPRFQETPLFAAICAAALAGLVVLLHRLRAGTLEARAALLEERNRLAGEMHDTLAQGLTGIALQLKVAEELLGEDVSTARACLVKARDLADRSLEEARRSVRGLAPVVRGDLASALELAARDAFEGTATEVRLQVDGARLKLPDAVEAELLRIGQEALRNARRHAQASRVSVLVAYGARLRLSVRDDGRGLARQEPPSRLSGFGVLSMRERARRIGARLSIGPCEGQGTEVVVELPLTRTAVEP